PLLLPRPGERAQLVALARHADDALDRLDAQVVPARRLAIDALVGVERGLVLVGLLVELAGAQQRLRALRRIGGALGELQERAGGALRIERRVQLGQPRLDARSEA